jgi:serine/threonine protein kinase
MARADKTDIKDTSPRDLGRYRLHGEIAAGGMATVYFGRLVGTAGFTKTVAIKCLHPQFAGVPEFVTMALAEARLAARIRHPNVAQTLDVLEIDGEIFLVLEYIDGESLSRLVRATVARHERVPIEIAISIACGILHGLHAAHEVKSDHGEPLGMVHRDVSPQNVLVGIDGVARVIDFGIAKAADSVQITREGELKGKLSYMAPEQLQGGKVTRKVDIYAASVILWELLAGQRLFDADYQSTIMKNILHRPVDRPSEIAPDVPADLDTIVLRGLARDPEERVTTAREMALAIEQRFVLANPSHVGRWVETVAAEALGRKARRIEQIEAVPSGRLPADDGTSEIRSDMIVASTRTRGDEPTTHPAKPPAPAFDPPKHPGGVGDIGPLLPPPTIKVDDRVAVGPEWPVPGIVPSPPGTETLPEAKKRSQGSGLLVFLVIIVLGVVGVMFVLPELLRRGYVASAARDGLVLSIDKVDVKPQLIELRGVTLSAVDVPGVTLRARQVDLTLKKLNPVEMTVHDGALAIDGSYARVHDATVAWVTSHATTDDVHGTLERIVLESGKVAWSRPFGEATSLDAENVTGEIERSPPYALGENLELAAAIVNLTTASGGKMGPWRLRWRKQPSVSQVTLLFDPASGAQVSALVGPTGVASVDGAIPHVPAAQLGLSASAFGRRAEDGLTILATLKGSAPSPGRLAGELHLVLGGARLSGAAASTDVEVYGKVDGDPAQPLDVRDGILGVGPVRGRLTGSIGVTAAFLRGDLVWRTGARCPAADQVVSGGLRFDTRALDEGGLSVSSATKCGVKVLPQ